MEVNLPVKRLSRLTWLQCIIIGFIFYLVVYYGGNHTHIIPFTLLTMLGILLVGYSDIFIMILLAKRLSSRSQRFSFLRRASTYISSIVIYLSLRPAFYFFSGRNWSFWELGSFFAFMGSGIVINTLITLLHDSVLLYEHKMYSELELSKMKNANTEATNLLLKQQIQPHFLFNALNTLKALYHKDTHSADKYIVHMANFLRASIYHQTAKISTLEDELKLLLDYLEMQRIRFGTALDCTININEEMQKSYYLPSFSLQPLLENAIKHNDFTVEHPLMVNIKEEDKWLIISNNLQKKNMKVASVNYGLANLAERYHLWSGDEIMIKEEHNTFSVGIKLLAHEHSNY